MGFTPPWQAKGEDIVTPFNEKCPSQRVGNCRRTGSGKRDSSKVVKVLPVGKPDSLSRFWIRRCPHSSSSISMRSCR